ncbi:polysaccharide deacetylase family protein [Pontiellaceae bacterium B12227]|nr:polysaccharide deacetylase family protein [Pontiellaceae bacterium B12227]
MSKAGYVIISVMLLMAGSIQGAEQKYVALTFDDGPNSPYTERILQTLEEKNVCATFFLIGRQVEKFPTIGMQIQESGHEIGGHSYDWDALAFKRWKTVEEKFDKMDAAFSSVGITNVVLFRPPNGMLSPGQKKKIEARGLTVVFGDIVPGDWKSVSAKTIRDRVLKRVRPGSIIVLHDGGGDRNATIAAVPLIIDGLKARGYVLVTVSELLGL